MRMFKKDEGFTLVELMVVVLIIGILVAVAIPIFNNASASARTRTCMSNQRTIEGAVQQYIATNPTAGWAAATIDGTDVLSGGANAYIKTPPVCPSDWGTEYSVDDSGTVTDDGNALTATGTDATDASHPHF